MPFRVLFVCTGNVCRSPTAELVFRSRADLRVVALSAGLAARPGDRVDLATAAALADIGVDATAHRAQVFTEQLARSAHLVLTAEAAQRDRVMVDVPSAFRRTFTLREFVRTAEATALSGSAALEARDVVGTVSRNRGAARSTRPGGDDIADPFGATADVAAGTVREIATQVQALVRLLGVEHTRPRPRPRPTTLRA